MDLQEFEQYCKQRGIEYHPELFEKYEYGFFKFVGDDDNLFFFLKDFVDSEKDSQPDHKMFTICSLLRCVMHRASKEKNMFYYWAAKLATKMAKRMDAKLKWYKNELS